MKRLIIAAVGLAMLSALAPPYGAEAQPVAEVKKLTASDAQDSDVFGRWVALSGDTAVVGAYSEAGAGFGRGAAYVFEPPLAVGGIAELPAIAGTGTSGMGGATYAVLAGAAYVAPPMPLIRESSFTGRTQRVQTSHRRHKEVHRCGNPCPTPWT